MTPEPTMLALVPSVGMKGGIEAYVSAVLDATRRCGWDVSVVSLAGPRTPSLKVASKARFVLHAAQQARRLGGADVVAVFHLGLLIPVLGLRWLLRTKARVVVFCYGKELWRGRRLGMRALRSVEVVTISSFAAGALVRHAGCRILEPGIPADRYRRLLAIERAPTAQEEGSLEVLSVFRLGDADAKGAETLIRAVGIARRSADVRLTIVGAGKAPPSLARQLSGLSWVSMIEGASDDDLMAQYAKADLFVLATRTKAGANASGEGFGIVLAEAALAQLPTVAPASGGSRDALVVGVTGLLPSDESAEALARSVLALVESPALRGRLGRSGREWARAAFSPDRYDAQVMQQVLGRTGSTPPLGVEIVAREEPAQYVCR